MNRSNRTRLAAALLLGAAGCAGSSTPDLPLTPVTGTVTLDGKPLADAELEFVPLGETHGLGGAARTAPDGAFHAAAPWGDPGLPAGEYQVVITKRELPPGTPPPDKETPRASIPYKQVLARTYSDPSASKLRATVATGGESVANFDLKSTRRR